MKKRGKVLASAIFYSISMFLAGCDTLEVEDREFPLAVAIEKAEEIESLWLNQEEGGKKEMDYNHLKVLILSQTLAEDEEGMEELLGVLSSNSQIPRNTYVAVAEKPKEILELKEEYEEKESAGTYIEELLEGNSSMKSMAYPTLGKLYQEQENHLETLFLPYLATQDNTPYVEKYFVWKRGAAAGVVSAPAAMLSAMLQCNLEKETIVFEEGNSIRISDFRVEEAFEEQGEKRILTAKITCEGEVLYEKEKLGKNRDLQYEKELQEYYQDIVDSALAQQIDLTNSYKKIGGYKREWNAYYQENPDAFEKEISILIEMDIRRI